MEPLHSIFLYSKYSLHSKKLETLIDNNELFSFRKLCIDNKDIRKRILEDKRLNIASVPSLIFVYPGGNVEVFEGQKAFDWVAKIEENYNRELQRRSYEAKLEQERILREQQLEQQLAQMQEEKKRKEEEKEEPEYIPIPRKKKGNITPLTSIEESTEQDEPEDNDRHKLIPPPPRIKAGKNEYQEDETFFADEKPETVPVVKTQKSARSSVKAQADIHGTKAKADEMLQGRKELETEFGDPTKRPLVREYSV